MTYFKTVDSVRTDFSKHPRRALLVTTVPCESQAVNAHLADRQHVTGSKGSIYFLGRFPDPAGDWTVVHAICQAGNSDSSLTVSRAHNDFGRFDVQMFVGVAGSLKGDIPIGSVVVGNYVYKGHSAKEDDANHYGRPHAHAAAPELLKAAQFLLLEPEWLGLIKNPIGITLPATSSYPCGFPPLAVIKAIVSGEVVVAGGGTHFFEVIRKNMNDAGAVEMEGYGAMNAAHEERTPAIVIRGISDMCGGKDHQSDAQLQPIASAHAAAFAFAILSFRSRSMPSSDDGPELLAMAQTDAPASAAEPANSDSTEISGHEGERKEFVLNFRGSMADWSDADTERVLQVLRETTGDPDVQLARVESGSVRLIVTILEKDAPLLSVGSIGPKIRRDLPLIGVGTVPQMLESDHAREEFKRSSLALLSWDQRLPGGAWLERPEREEIESRFRSESSSTVLLGEPGSGKSALLSSILMGLVENEEAVLGIKADFISRDVRSEHDLQQDLQLSSLPSEMIEALAKTRPVYLVIDQLDALASQVDLKSDRLNILLNLVRRVAGLSNVHVVLSARTFEFNHDVRLKAVDAEAVTLSLPAWHDVRASLSSAGIDPDVWPESAREIVRNPQALKTYLALDSVPIDPPISKYQSMLEDLWRQKIINEPDGPELTALASEIAGIMADEETLWLAAARFDTRARSLGRLEAAGILVRSQGSKSITFSHQTIFEFVLARSFAGEPGRLSSYVLLRQNSLFVRGKMWSALNFLRDTEPSAYEHELSVIWKRPELRRHLRLLLIEFLGEVQAPSACEKLFFSQALRNSDLRSVALKSMAGSSGLFSEFAGTEVRDAMVGGGDQAQLGLRVLQRAWSFAHDEVIRLIQENWLGRPELDLLTWSLLESCPTWDQKAESVAITVLRRTLISWWHLDHVASTVAVDQPEIAFRLVRANLELQQEEARRAPAGEPYPEDGSMEEQMHWHLSEDPLKRFSAIVESTEWHSFPAMAENSPKAFLDVMWPWFAAIFSDLVRKGEDDSTSVHRYPGRSLLELSLTDEDDDGVRRESPLLEGLRVAIQHVARDASTFFVEWLKAAQRYELFDVQRLIAYGLSQAPERYGSLALDWLLFDSRRLALGDYRNMRQTSVALIRAASPFWAEEEVRKFEAYVKAYRPVSVSDSDDASRRRSVLSHARRARALLLSAISTDQLSPESTGLVTTERRAFGQDLAEGVRSFGGGFIGSPMESAAMEKAKDRDILNIFEQVPDGTNWDHPTEFMRGGNIQLSRAFADFAKSQPDRALQLLHSFNPESQARAAGYALDALAEDRNLDQKVLVAFLSLYERGFGKEEFRSSATSAIEKVARRTAVGESVIDALLAWLRSPVLDEEVERVTKDSEAEEETEEEVRAASVDREGSILWGHSSMSVLPSGNFPILSALATILLSGSEKGRDRLFSILNEHLAAERDPATWRAMLRRISRAGGSNPKVVSEFVRALFSHHPDLLETKDAVHFLAYAISWDQVLVGELIDSWACSRKPWVRQAYGELVGLAVITRDDAEWKEWRDAVIDSGDSPSTSGLAHAAANLWESPDFHNEAGALLTRLVPGSDAPRMHAILDVFRKCDELRPDGVTLSLLEALARPDVNFFGAPSTFMVERLQTLMPHAADVIGQIALKLVATWKSDLADVRTATALAAPQLTDLAITLHRLGGSPRDVGIEVFEKLIEIEAYGARDTLFEIDGRFGQRNSVSRRRISRRRPKAGSRVRG